MIKNQLEKEINLEEVSKETRLMIDVIDAIEEGHELAKLADEEDILNVMARRVSIER